MNENSKSKYMAVVKDSQVRVYQYGAVSRRGCSRLVNISGICGRPPKSRITSFSKASRRRLRELLITRHVEGGFPYALTTTLPNSRQLPEPERLIQLFPETVRRFGLFFERRFPRSAFVWRAELQKRGIPHLHCLVWMHGDDFAIDSPLPYSENSHQTRAGYDKTLCYGLLLDLAGLWFRAVVQTLDVPQEYALYWLHDCLDFGKGIDVSPLRDAPRLLRYCSDHLSKHKQEQLGYVGRQWGVVGKRRMSAVPSIVLDSRKSEIMFARVLGKIRRCRVSDASSPFGWKHSPYHPANAGVSFAGRDTLRRLCDWLDVGKEVADEKRRAPQMARSFVGVELAPRMSESVEDIMADLPRIARARTAYFAPPLDGVKTQAGRGHTLTSVPISSQGLLALGDVC